jgi:hypothetical protein
MVIVPVRDDELVFCETEYDTEPLPVPLEPAVTVIHVALLVEVHEHEDEDAVTLTDPVPPDAAKELLDGDMVYVHEVVLSNSAMTF